MISGPIAYARTKIESTRLVWSEEVMWSSLAIRPRAGATIVEDIGVMSATVDISVVICKCCEKEEGHFLWLHTPKRLLKAQFFGLAGSFGPSQDTYGQVVQLSDSAILISA